jgi:hypothetical protein
MGLPNTAMLLDGVLDLARRSGRWQTEELEQRLEKAFRYFYPDAIRAGYRPDVVDFFSALRTYLDVGAGLPGGFAGAPHLYRSLKSAIAHLLIEKLRQCDQALKRGHPYLDEMIASGNFISRQIGTCSSSATRNFIASPCGTLEPAIHSKSYC